MGNPYMMLSHKSEGSSTCTYILFPFLKSFPESLSALPYYLSASAVCSKLSPPSSPPTPQKRFRKVGQIKNIDSPEALVIRMWRKPLWCHRLHFEMLNIKECKLPAYFLIFFFHRTVEHRQWTLCSEKTKMSATVILAWFQILVLSLTGSVSFEKWFNPSEPQISHL